MKLSLRDKQAGGLDTWNPDSGVAQQDRGSRVSPPVEQLQKGLNQAKPANNVQPTVVKEEKSNGRIIRTLKDSAGKLFKQIFEGGKIVYDSRRNNAMASVRERQRRLISAGRKQIVKASKEDWIIARDRLIEKLMQENGWDESTTVQYLDENPEIMENAAVDYAADKAEHIYTMMGA